MDQNTEDLVTKVASLSRQSRVALIKRVIRQSDKDEVKELFDAACRVLLPMQAVERWMEKRFKEDMSLQPYAVATLCRHVKRIDSRMYQHLLAVAQKVKNRLRMRIRRIKETGS